VELQPLNLPPLNGTGPASALSSEAAISTQKFHGAKPPKFVIVEEKPWHYAAALMFARGEVSASEVARAFEVTPPTVYNLMRQEWFQARVTQLMAEHGGKDIMQLFRAEGWNSFVTLLELRDEPKISSTVRAACARDILDRALGKPLQRIETSGEVTSSDPVAEVARLEEENARKRSIFSPPE
jgi:transposase-like protein